MDTQAAMYLLPYVVSLVISLAVAGYVWRLRHVTGSTAYAMLALAQASWTLGYILELVSADLPTKLFWDDFQYIGTLMYPAMLWIFIWQYTGRRVTRPILIGLLAFPVLILLLVASGNAHGWLRADEQLVPGTPFASDTYEFLPLLYVLSIYIYAVSIWGFGLLGRQFWRVQSIYRAQIVTIFVGTLIPFITGLMIIAGIQLIDQRDMMPLAFAISHPFILWGLLRYKLFNIVPVARETVVERMNAAVIVLDNTLTIVDANPAAQALAPQKQIIGQPFGQMFFVWQPFLMQIVQHPQHATQQTEIVWEKADKRTHYELNLTPLYQHQRLSGYLLVARDITERVSAQEEIQRRSRELEAANQELTIAWEAAKQADRVKSQFLASMSHELRTPLNAILNFTEFVSLGLLGDVNERQKDALDKSLSSGRHLLELINDVLDMTKIESGMMKLFVEDNVRLQPEFEQVISTTQTLLQDKSVRLVTDIDDDLPTVLGDRRRIRQVLLNLLSNAAKFTEEGSITFSVKYRDQHLLFAVIDSGPGIAADEQALIFEPFKQTHAGIQHAQGTGLGLPISRKLVEAHGGDLWVESEPGEGAAFYVRLPIRHPLLEQQMASMMEAIEVHHA
jgi:PAS domain S-box-containing protein